MMKEEYRDAMEALIYLDACALKGVTPDKSRAAQMDIEKLYQAADRHLLTAITACALESAGIRNAAFTQAKAKAIRKNILLDTERASILQKLEEAGIWYMPLKGALLKDLYPQIGMRQMADNDILIDGSRAGDVRRIMEDLGFTTEEFGRGNHDCYVKEPVYNFEMHRALFSDWRNKEFYEYYRNVKERLIKDDGNRCGWHFSDEDFYIYMVAHEYKHYSGSGTGIRSLMDAYVYCTSRGDTLNWPYIAGEMEKLHLTEFEQQNRMLAMQLFGEGEQTEADPKMLDYIISSGTYGTMENNIQNQLEQKGKTGYLISRAFPGIGFMTILYPFLRRIPVLLPFCWVHRLVKAVFMKWKTVRYQFLAMFRKTEE